MKLSQIAVLVIVLLISPSVLSQQHRSDIRSLDFANFTYPWTADLLDPTNPKKTFTLRNGELPATHDKRGFIDEMGVFLQGIKYGDVTGDGVEEAIVSLSILTGGSARPGIIYIYALQKGRPVLLWSHSTGDRADGGLRDVYAENGQLVVELYSSVGSRGDCCPSRFTRTHYEWREGHFRQKRKETLPVPGSR